MDPSSNPQRSLNRQVILEEEEYTEALSHIIARDFFPSLVHLDATNTYLDALTSKDPQLIQASVRRLEDLATPVSRRGGRYTLQTPYGAGPSDTPLRTPRGEEDDGPPNKRARYDTDINLDTFQARYTSEDNSSFTQILDDENMRRKEKYSWAWDAQRRVDEQRGKMLERRERLLIEAPAGAGVRERFTIEAPTPKGLITASGESNQGKSNKLQDIGGEAEEGATEDSGKGKEVSIVKKSQDTAEGEEVDVMAPKKDTRLAGVDGWKFKARNALMFAPDADESPYHPSPTQAAENAKSIPKIIKHDNTRLPEQEESSKSVSEPPSPTRSRIEAAIAGEPYRPKSPTVNNFSLVPNLPSPTPSELGPKAVKQLMTWGTLTATPRILSQSDDEPSSSSMPPPSTPFHIAAPSARENLSHRLSNDASKSLRAKAILLNGGTPRTSRSGTRSKGSMPPPSWTPRKADAAGNLTPAARRLLDRTSMGTAASRRAEAMGRIAGWEGSSSAKEKDLNRVRWTPTPSPVSRRGM
ncbi:nuclear protein DGCR14 [Abortiporus biennis]|nr:nuclear protein DGCR14 [Abortiporus biennis]